MMAAPPAGPSHPRARWRFALALATAALAGGGCQTFMPKSDNESSKKGWEHSYFLNHRVPYAKLEVEIDVVQGTAPSSGELRELQAFLERFCDKPGGITLKIDDLIPRRLAATRGVESLALEYCRGPTDPQAAYLYLIYYDTRLRGPGVSVDKPAFSHLFPTIYIDRGYRIRGNPYPSTFARAVLLHEAGHALGLCASDNHHGAEGHCIDEKCLMAPALHFSIPRFFMLRNPWVNRALCGDCVDELARNKTNAPGRTQHYRNGYVVRSEGGYHLLTAPGLVYVHFGDDDLPPNEEFITWRNKIAGEMARGETVLAYATNTFDLVQHLDAVAHLAREKDEKLHDIAQRLFADFAGKLEQLATEDADTARTILTDALLRSMDRFPDLQDKVTQIRSRLGPAASVESKTTGN